MYQKLTRMQTMNGGLLKDNEATPTTPAPPEPTVYPDNALAETVALQMKVP